MPFFHLFMSNLGTFYPIFYSIFLILPVILPLLTKIPVRGSYRIKKNCHPWILVSSEVNGVSSLYDNMKKKIKTHTATAAFPLIFIFIIIIQYFYFLIFDHQYCGAPIATARIDIIFRCRLCNFSFLFCSYLLQTSNIF